MRRLYFLLYLNGLHMSNISMTEALISKLYNGVIEIAEYTCSVLNKKTTIAQLAANNPSFEEIAEICDELLVRLKEYKKTDDRFRQAEELVGILRKIVDAIPKHDNSMLIDCTFHLEQYLEINVRTGNV